MTGARQPKRPSQKRIHRNRGLAAVLVLVLTLIGWTISTRTNDATVTPIAAPTTPEPGPSPDRTYGSFTLPRPGRDVSWRVFAGIDLPISATAGPYYLSDTRARGFAHTADGAAIAAAQLLVRTFPFAGPKTFEPTIREQVTGTSAPTFARLTQQTYREAATASGVRQGDPIRSTDGWIAAYRPHRDQDPAGPKAIIDVLIAATGDGSGFTTYTVKLTWQDGDWRLIAPDWGDWRSNAEPVAHPYPDSYRSYDTLGIGPGGAS